VAYLFLVRSMRLVVVAAAMLIFCAIEDRARDKATLAVSCHTTQA
jgi:hypothetical protein